MRVVLDTSVLVAGLRSRLGASNRLLALVAEGRCVPLVTTAVFLEYEDVLLRPEHRLATGMIERDVAVAIVTHNLRDFLPVERSFGIAVKTPARVLKELSK